jgi:hypothetical protein
MEEEEEEEDEELLENPENGNGLETPQVGPFVRTNLHTVIKEENVTKNAMKIRYRPYHPYVVWRGSPLYELYSI